MSDKAEIAPEKERVTNPETRRNKYNRAVREARLVAIDLRAVNFSVYPDANQGDPVKTKRRFGSDIVEFDFDSNYGFVFSCIRWTIDIRAGRKKVSSCKIEYNVVYDGFSGNEEEVIRKFVQYVATPATYAYCRALYAQLDWSAGFNSPPLPVVKFNPDV